jgi:hypothetical protein
LQLPVVAQPQFVVCDQPVEQSFKDTKSQCGLAAVQLATPG